jgi:hypothetical protein
MVNLHGTHVRGEFIATGEILCEFFKGHVELKDLRLRHLIVRLRGRDGCQCSLCEIA